MVKCKICDFEMIRVKSSGHMFCSDPTPEPLNGCTYEIEGVGIC
jgi:hypothetical protein